MRFALLLAPFLLAAESRFTSVERVRVHYDDSGSGSQAVVLIHGWTCDQTFWRRTTPAIAAKYRVLAVDLPGHGKSDKPEITYDMPLFARAVGAVMKDAGVSRAVLVGHSMGVPVARHVIQLYPDKINGFVAVDGFFSKKPATPEEVDKFNATWDQSSKNFRGPDYKEFFEKGVNSMFGPATTPELREEIRAKMLSAPQHVVASARESMRDLAYYNPDPIGVPVIALFAKRPQVNADAEAYVRGFVPKLDWRVWDGVNHFLMMEKPEEFNRLLLEFLGRL
jgi:pimeloyl-ACP methyl ester carboxylesterase